jgi:hypothetical protein
LSGLFTSEISIEFDAPIWELNVKGGLLLITTRNSELLQTHFHLYDMKQQVFVFDGLSFEEEWWISIFLWNGDQIVFQTYEDTQDIEQRTAFCYDIERAEVIWSIDGVKLQQVDPQSIMCVKLGDKGDAFVLDVASGEQVERAPSPLKAVENVQYPLQYAEESEYYAVLKQFIEERSDISVLGEIEYLEWNGLIFVGANYKSENSYALRLFIYDNDGQIQFVSDIEREMKGLAIGSFFMVGEAIIFVERKHMLKIYSFA